MYGDEESGLPSESLYTDEDAKEALSYANYVYGAYIKLLEAVKSK